MHDDLYDTLTKMINNAKTEDDFQDISEFMVKTLNITPEEQKHLSVLVSRDELARRKKFT